MSIENKGTVATKYIVTKGPDRSGNYVAPAASTSDEDYINAAINDLTAGRTQQEKIVIRGDFSIDGPVVVPSYTFLEIQGSLTVVAQNTSNAIEMTGVSDPHATDITIMHGRLIGTGEAYDGSEVAQCGILASYVDDSIVFDVSAYEFSANGFHIQDGGGSFQKGVTLLDCRATDGLRNGFRMNGVRNNYLRGCVSEDNADFGFVGIGGEEQMLISCVSNNNGFRGFYFPAGDNIKIIGCKERLSGDIGFCLGGGGGEPGEHAAGVIMGCTTDLPAKDGIYIFEGAWVVANNVVLYAGGAGPDLYDGIKVITEGEGTLITGNKIYRTQVVEHDMRHGIYVENDYCTIVGNYIEHPKHDGIHIEGGNYNLIADNTIVDCDGWGIEIDADGDYNMVVNNYTQLNGSGGINIANANCDENVVKGNRMIEATKMTDAGTDTIFAVVPYQFTEPIGTAAIIVASPTGIDVDGDTEGALAWGQIPHEVQQVMRLKVWAVALDGPVNAGGQMHLELTFNAGASNAAYNEAGKSWTVADFDSEEADYVANDVVHWVIEDGDVGSELANLVEGDSFEMLVTHEAAADPDGATDALFRVLEVEYV